MEPFPESGEEIAKPDPMALDDDSKLRLADRANEIYKQQLKYMHDHLSSLRSLIQDKEMIIENLLLRYDLGIFASDPLATGNDRVKDDGSFDRVEGEELRRKAEALAQRTILENFEMRELVNELRDENFHLRNEIYELQDSLNRKTLELSRLKRGERPIGASVDSGEKRADKKEKPDKEESSSAPIGGLFD